MKSENRIKWLHIRLNEAELQVIYDSHKKTTERNLSAYCRKLLLGQPMIKGVRDLTSEDLMVEFSGLLKTLNGIANNYNQAVHKLHLLPQSRPALEWLERYEADRKGLLENIADIKSFLNNAGQIWLQ